MVFVILLVSMGILLAHVRIQKFKKYCKKDSNLTKDTVFQKKLVLSHALIPRSIEQQENSPRTEKLSQKSTKNDENYESFHFDIKLE